ncbi:hypothetical protein ACTFIW_003366 [Dictyostelium discoideum]
MYDQSKIDDNFDIIKRKSCSNHLEYWFLDNNDINPESNFDTLVIFQIENVTGLPFQFKKYVLHKLDYMFRYSQIVFNSSNMNELQSLRLKFIFSIKYFIFKWTGKGGLKKNSSEIMKQRNQKIEDGEINVLPVPNKKPISQEILNRRTIQ